MYDTLAGGAGFSPQLAVRGEELFNEALRILESCPAECDASCYRCLRSFRNKIEHRLLDRKLGQQLLRHAIYGGYQPYSPERMQLSIEILTANLTRQFPNFRIERNVRRSAGNADVTVDIIMTNATGGTETWIALSSPVAPEVAATAELRRLAVEQPQLVVCVDDLLVRRNLPAAVKIVQRSLR